MENEILRKRMQCDAFNKIKQVWTQKCLACICSFDPINVWTQKFSNQDIYQQVIPPGHINKTNQ